MESTEETLFHRLEITFDLNILKPDCFPLRAVSLTVLQRPRLNGELWKGLTVPSVRPHLIWRGTFPSSSFVRLSGTTKAGIHTNFGGIRPMSQPTNYLVLVCLKVILQISKIFLHPGFSTLNRNTVSEVHSLRNAGDYLKWSNFTRFYSLAILRSLNN